MELLAILLVLLGLIALDLLALRLGSDTRDPMDRRPNWW